MEGQVNVHSDKNENQDLNGEFQNKNQNLSVAIDLRSNSFSVKDATAWIKRSFGPIGAYGSIKKDLFITALREVENFAENLFNTFDTKDQGCISIQELVGGFGLLIANKEQKKLRQWFSQYFENICEQESFIYLHQFTKALEDDTFANNFFKIFDLNGDGEIEMKDLIAGLDRLHCTSIDAKWYLWIQDKFDVNSSNERVVSFDQFITALHLKKSFFAERFYAIFDTDSNGTIDMKELVDGLTLLTKGTKEDKLKFLFEVYDIDGNGVLNMEEIKIVLQSCIEESNIKMADEQINELAEVFFEGTDHDNDGCISFEEFQLFLTKYPGVAENLTMTAAHLLNPPEQKKKKRFFDFNLRKKSEYIKKNPSEVAFYIMYFLINLALTIWVCIQRKDEGGWVILARFNGMCLNFNGMFVLVLMLKGSLTWLRSTRIGKYFPIDNHIEFHKIVAAVILFQSVLHFIGHLGRYIVTESGIEVWEYLFTTRGGEGWVNGSAGITGVLLFIIFGVMAVMSLPFVRSKGYFEMFYFTHHLYIIWWTLLILHAPNFWKWFLGPAVIYVIERILRLKFVNEARFGKTFIKEGIVLPSKVIHLIISRPPNFNYKSGDYVLINVPKIAKYEWHPFTISSSPEMTETIWLHVRSVGTWTRKLYAYFEDKKIKGLVRGRSSKKSLRRLRSEERSDPEVAPNKPVPNPNSIPEQETLNGLQNRNGNTETKKSSVKFESTNSGFVSEEDGRNAVSLSVPSETRQRTKSLQVPDGLLEVYVDGPYGAPAVHFSEAEHAVLISSGIGVTPFASILQTIIMRYKSASHTCPNCEHSWVGKIPFSLKKLKKVDFFWINRDQSSFEWFISLLSQLEMEQSEERGVLSEHFLDMHIYMTSALKKEDMKALGLQLALELIHEKKERDLITGLRTRTKPGRPNWEKVFVDLETKNHGKISVFYCGNPALGKILKVLCDKHKFAFRKENF